MLYFALRRSNYLLFNCINSVSDAEMQPPWFSGYSAFTCSTVQEYGSSKTAEQAIKHNAKQNKWMSHEIWNMIAFNWVAKWTIQFVGDSENKGKSTTVNRCLCPIFLTLLVWKVAERKKKHTIFFFNSTQPSLIILYTNSKYYTSACRNLWASIKPGTWNIPEHSGTFRNIPEHPGIWKN